MKHFDRETKIVLLNALKRGCFDQSDIDVLTGKGYIEKMQLEIKVHSTGVPIARNENEITE